MSTLLASPAAAADSRYADRVAEALECRLERQIRNLQLEFLPEGLVLFGQAPCYYTRAWAQEQAEAFTGLPVLCNNIVVS